MARSHICVKCGTDLGRLRAPPDPHYAQPVVLCTGCATAVVRRPYGGTARWRSARRTALTAVKGTLRIWLLLALALFTLSTAAGIAEGVDFTLASAPLSDLFSLDARQRVRLAGWWEDEGALRLLSWLICSAAMGALVGIAFPHWRVGCWVLGVASATIASLLLVPVVEACTDFAFKDAAFLASWERRLPDWRDTLLTLSAIAGALAISASTMPAGLRVGRRLSARGLGSRRLRRTRRLRSTR